MAQNNDLFKGVAIGIGAAILVPVAIAALAPIVKPLARSAMKSGILAYEKLRETVEEFGETVEDMVAEVDEEMIDAEAAEESMAEAETVTSND
jgi:hypothetical protein